MKQAPRCGRLSFACAFPPTYGTLAGQSCKLRGSSEGDGDARARQDGSVAWNVKILSESGFYAARLSETACKELYPSIDSATAGALSPQGRADVIGDDFEVTGLWHWGSGIKSADQVVGGVNVYGNGEMRRMPSGAPMILYVYLPLSKIKIEDNWYVTGMRGEQQQLLWGDKGPCAASTTRSCARRRRTPAPIRCSKHAELPFFNTIGTTLGLATHALDVAKQRITSGKEPLARQQAVQRSYGEAWSYLDAARSHAYTVAAAMDEALFTENRLLDDELYARMLAATATAHTLSKRIMDIAIELNGAGSIFWTNPLERVIRDLQTNGVHIINTPRKWSEASTYLLRGSTAA